MKPIDYLIEQSDRYGILYAQKQLDMFEVYADKLLEWNQKMNLTAITDPQEIMVKHFLDSLLLLTVVHLPKGAKLIDVGTGAGFPGMALKIMRPDLRVTLLDSLQKRLTFLQVLADELGIPDIEYLHARAEDAGRNPAHREQYDFAVSRAVANLRELSEYCLPLVRQGGYFISYKGYEMEEEAAQAEKAVEILGGRLEHVEKLELPGDNKRSLLFIKKISQTSSRFPRMPAKIAKNPII
ncbi:16S rRNA (guanine(527)-N(7))-methyltransferase RsmG [Candidatus Soleaferrea massiliensis]|uniref:16S rRNA (guanine(527)-N(7))-methyltransferase RsmG n=1 Tax=Candidatus Soleaferrea massiliensis TaxID=1470354 RepID=UPI00058CC6BF|nr:16S rRNA (guanine(527)-N(7))-methyltransferase RsmG [Candidatus Soleaferrea massiliensis]